MHFRSTPGSVTLIHTFIVLHRKMVLQYGLWDQIRTDQGKEWNLLLFVNQMLSFLRNDCTKPPRLQSTSKQVIIIAIHSSIINFYDYCISPQQNHIVERIWVEVNARVNYPVKEVLIDMMESGDFSLDSDLDKFCVSWFSIQVAAVGIQLFVASWNTHPIPGSYM